MTDKLDKVLAVAARIQAEARYVSSLVSPDLGFIHPVSGDAFPLEKGDQLLQHKLTDESFAVMSATGDRKYQVNKLGKKCKWSPHIPDSNYRVIYTEPTGSTAFDPQIGPDARDYLSGNVFTHPVSGLEVEIGPDEKLMQHTFTPNSYLIMGVDGTMRYKIDVKGRKQKAGSNLKPTNYAEVPTVPEART